MTDEETDTQTVQQFAQICLQARLQCLDPEPPWSGYDAESSAVAVGVRKLGFTMPVLPKRKGRLTEVN